MEFFMSIFDSLRSTNKYPSNLMVLGLRGWGNRTRRETPTNHTKLSGWEAYNTGKWKDFLFCILVERFVLHELKCPSLCLSVCLSLQERSQYRAQPLSPTCHYIMNGIIPVLLATGRITVWVWMVNQALLSRGKRHRLLICHWPCSHPALPHCLTP